jgi:hypothetical protein
LLSTAGQHLAVVHLACAELPLKTEPIMLSKSITLRRRGFLGNSGVWGSVRKLENQFDQDSRKISQLILRADDHEGVYRLDRLERWPSEAKRAPRARGPGIFRGGNWVA